MVLLAQIVRALGCEPRGMGALPIHHPKYGPVDNWFKSPSFQVGKLGSIPSGVTIYVCSSTDRILGFEPNDEGAIPSRRTNNPG